MPECTVRIDLEARVQTSPARHRGALMSATETGKVSGGVSLFIAQLGGTITQRAAPKTVHLDRPLLFDRDDAMLIALEVAHALQLRRPMWATHIGNCAESGALQAYMRHRTVQTAQHTYETRSGLHKLICRIVAASVGEVCSTNLT